MSGAKAVKRNHVLTASEAWTLVSQAGFARRRDLKEDWRPHYEKFVQKLVSKCYFKRKGTRARIACLHRAAAEMEMLLRGNFASRGECLEALRRFGATRKRRAA